MLREPMTLLKFRTRLWMGWVRERCGQSLFA
jgi:hypothetical protein